MKTIIVITFFMMVSCLNANTLSTQWGGLADTIAIKLESYAAKNKGELPPNLDDLFTGSIRASIEEQLGGPVSSKLTYYKNQMLRLKGNEQLQMIAILAFPIEEDRRTALERYVVYRKPNGKMEACWQDDNAIRESLAEVEFPCRQLLFFVNAL